MTSVNLKKLDNMLNEALEKETKESLNKWLSEKDTDTVIQGWVARDENERLCLYQNEPKRESYDFFLKGYWTDRTNQYIDIPPNLFPDFNRREAEDLAKHLNEK